MCTQPWHDIYLNTSFSTSTQCVRGSLRPERGLQTDSFRSCRIPIYSLCIILCIGNHPNQTFLHGKATHCSLSVANAPPNCVRCHLKGKAFSASPPIGSVGGYTISPCENPVSPGGRDGVFYILKSLAFVKVNHPALEGQRPVIVEVKPFSGLPWPGVPAGILRPVSFQP